jgi:hypothetical protein
VNAIVSGGRRQCESSSRVCGPDEAQRFAADLVLSIAPHRRAHSRQDLLEKMRFPNEVLMAARLPVIVALASNGFADVYWEIAWPRS